MWPTKNNSEPWRPFRSYWDEGSQALDLDVWVGLESWLWRCPGPSAEADHGSISERKGAALVGWPESLITPTPWQSYWKKEKLLLTKMSLWQTLVGCLFKSCLFLTVPIHCFLPRQWNPNLVSVLVAMWFGKMGPSPTPGDEQWLV